MCLQECVFLQSHQSLNLGPILFQHDFILTNYICKGTNPHQRSHSQVPGGHGLQGNTIQYGALANNYSSTFYSSFSYALSCSEAFASLCQTPSALSEYFHHSFRPFLLLLMYSSFSPRWVGRVDHRTIAFVSQIWADS